jgi:hypothetical protein
MDEVVTAVSELNPTLCCFCESWLDVSTPDCVVALANYQCIRQDRCTGSGGGLLIYLLDSFNIIRIDPSVFSSGSSEILPVFLPVSNTLLILIYHPFWGSSPAHELASSAIIDICDYVTASSGPGNSATRIVVCGDFNDLRLHLDPLLDSLHLTNLVHFPPRANAALDLVLTNRPGEFLPPLIRPPLGRSDHCGVFVRPVCSLRPSSIPPVKKYVRKFCPASMAAFGARVLSMNWTSLVTEALAYSLDDAVDVLHSGLRQAFDTSFPLRVVRCKVSDPPWLSSSLRLLMNQRDRAFKEKKVLKYIRLKEEIITLSRSLRKNFFERGTSQKDPKTAWKTVKSLCGMGLKKRSPLIDVVHCSSLFAASFTPKRSLVSPNSPLLCTSESPSLDKASIEAFSVAEVVQCLQRLKN